MLSFIFEIELETDWECVSVSVKYEFLTDVYFTGITLSKVTFQTYISLKQQMFALLKIYTVKNIKHFKSVN